MFYVFFILRLSLNFCLNWMYGINCTCLFLHQLFDNDTDEKYAGAEGATPFQKTLQSFGGQGIRSLMIRAYGEVKIKHICCSKIGHEQ